MCTAIQNAAHYTCHTRPTKQPGYDWGHHISKGACDCVLYEVVSHGARLSHEKQVRLAPWDYACMRPCIIIALYITWKSCLLDCKWLIAFVSSVVCVGMLKWTPLMIATMIYVCSYFWHRMYTCSYFALDWIPMTPSSMKLNSMIQYPEVYSYCNYDVCNHLWHRMYMQLFALDWIPMTPTSSYEANTISWGLYCNYDVCMI